MPARAPLSPQAAQDRRAGLLEHREILLNYFRARKAISGGVIEALNNRIKVTFRKSYGFRTDKAREIALFHVLGKLPEPELIHGFFSQSSHSKRMRNVENKGFLTTLDAVGRCVPVKMPATFQKANKINGFVHIPYGTAMGLFRSLFRIFITFAGYIGRCSPSFQPDQQNANIGWRNT